MWGWVGLYGRPWVGRCGLCRDEPMSSVLQPLEKGNVPDFLTIGHVTRDIFPDQAFSLGGTVTFAALTAYRLGLVAAITTCADAELLAELPAD